MARTRVDIISDTHGRLSPELLAQLQGADVIVHAGDITSTSDYMELETIAPVHLCLGNNDWGYDYGPEVRKLIRFYIDDLLFCVSHYREMVEDESYDVGVCGHTHNPFINEEPGGALLINPGSTTFPRTSAGPTMARLIIEDGQVSDAQIVSLAAPQGDGGSKRHWWEAW